MSLKVVTIILGILIVVTRIPYIISPSYSKEALKKIITSTFGVKFLSLICLFFGISMFMTGISLDVFLNEIAVVLGAIMSVVGIILLFKPFILVDKVFNRVLKLEDFSLRKLGIVGVIFGLILIILGALAY